MNILSLLALLLLCEAVLYELIPVTLNIALDIAFLGMESFALDLV